MRTRPECSLRNRANRDNVDELCCLYVLGDLTTPDREALEEHLTGCKECRDSVSEFERIVLFDLPAAAVSRAEGSVPEHLGVAAEAQLLTRVLERAGLSIASGQGENRITNDFALRCPVPWRKRIGGAMPALFPAAGWAIAASLLLWIGWTSWINQKSGTVVLPLNPSQSVKSVDVLALEVRVATAEKQREVWTRRLIDAESQAHRDAVALSQLSTRYQSLVSTDSVLQSELVQERASLNQKAAETELTRNQLNHETAEKDALQTQLSEVYARFEKQGAEVARLERIATAAPPRFPVVEREVGDNEAREILGARDLHIVDVYDVDRSGKSSRVYGRVYYVNRSLLVFYAFDLSEQEKNHKAVAFQAWGFRQPESASPESLGLFYMDDARLNRWTLRVSDPELLSRIDTLFVTAEPPGGSHFPKGRHLLMASLAGPANHP